MRRNLLLLSCLLSQVFVMAQKENPAPIIPEADGFFIIPQAKMQPDKNHVYKAVYDATKFPKEPTQILPALNMAGSELNALAVCKIPLSQAKFVVVFHGSAIDGILNNEHYKEKYNIDNPNVKVLNELKKAGVKLFVCGQNLLAENIKLNAISTDVTVASDALIVLMTFQNEGYALLSF